MSEQRTIEPLACRHPVLYAADVSNQPWAGCLLCEVERLRGIILAARRNGSIPEHPEGSSLHEPLPYGKDEMGSCPKCGYRLK
jgi:hypothetical protein